MFSQFKPPYKPPVPRAWKVCNYCYQVYSGNDKWDIGPRFDGSTTLVLRPEGYVYHVYNGLHPEKMCKLSPKIEVELYPGGNILPFDPDQCEKFKFIHAKKEHLRNLIPKFIIDRLTKVAPQNEGIERDIGRREKIISKPAHSVNEILIGGSYPLFLYLSEKKKKFYWYNNDVDIFILKKMSLNGFSIRQRLLRYAMDGKHNPWVSTFSFGCRHRHVDVVRTTCNSVEDFINSIDISVVGFFIVHKTTEVPEDVVLIREVWDEWFLMAIPEAIEDIENDRITLYRREEDPLYPKSLSRLSKYKERMCPKEVVKRTMVTKIDESTGDVVSVTTSRKTNTDTGEVIVETTSKKVDKDTLPGPFDIPCCVGGYPWGDDF